MLKLADLPSEILAILAEMLGNPLALLVSRAHLSKAFCVAARTAQATLTTLNLAYYSKTTDAVVVAVASACKQLTSLNLEGCDKITDAAVVAVASGCKQLTTLHLCRCRNITGSLQHLSTPPFTLVHALAHAKGSLWSAPTACTLCAVPSRF